MADAQSTCATLEEQQVEHREIPGCPGYRAGSDGSVWSCFSGTWKELSHAIDAKGRPKLSITMNGQNVQRKVCELIASAFLGDRPDGCICLHWNDAPADNRSSNLRWGTYRDNAQDSIRNGTKAKGESHGCSKLTEADIREIRGLSLTPKVIMERYGLSHSQATRILNGEAWRHVQ